MGSRDVFHRRADAGADAFHGCILLCDPRSAGLAGAGVEVGAHLWRDGVALCLAILGLSVDETPHDVVDGVDRRGEKRWEGGTGMNTMKNWKRRYRDMGTLFWVVVVILLLGVTTEAYCVADIFRQAEPDKALAGIYGLNIVCLTFICVQVLRLDCRNLLTRRTVRIFMSSGLAVLLYMVARGHLDDYITTTAAVDGLHDSTLIYLLGFLLVFVGEVVRRAVRIKEEQDLTI